MSHCLFKCCGAVVAACVIVGGSLAVLAEPAAEKPEDGPAAEHSVSLDLARDRATQLHATLQSTLHVLHQYYFHDDLAAVPARAMEDVFADLASQTGAKVEWIAVNTKPMSIDHEPDSDFERKTAVQIAAGKDFYDEIDKDYFRSAITLGPGCVSCHTDSFAPPPKRPRFAGLVVSIPIRSE